ncbi:MAG: amino acid adenylation domain-containing protein, partial [Candidatus Aminicenantes bacterium]
TSGSTGKPKGVMVEHRNLTAYLHAFEQEFEILPTDTVIQQASYSFDAFAEEVYPVLVKGGKIAILGNEEVKDMALLTDFILRHRVTIIDCSPLLLNQLNQLDFKSNIRIFISGGDVLKGEYIDNLIKKGTVYNTYGPTETTICASYYKCSGVVQHGVPIGKPIGNYCIYILNHHNRLLPIGIPGELCISGNGVSRGYLNQPQLTAEKFLHVFYISYRSHRSYIYQTGDLARWLADGNIEYLGRIDQQVKIRGYRIELQEIEHHLITHDDIKEAVVINKEEKNENKYLCAYLVSTEGKKNREFTFTVAELRKYLSGKLPDYMIPTHFIEINEIPLTPNGKINVKALYEYHPGGNIETGTPYVAPTNEVEKKLVRIFEENLIKNRIGIHDNFFELGGDSVKGITLVNRFKEILGEIVHITVIFDSPTVAELAVYFKKHYPHGYASMMGKESKTVGDIKTDEKETFVTVERIAEVRRMLPVWSVPDEIEHPRNPRAVFVLSPPRTGSTLLRVMLAGHPRLFAPPELNLLPYATLQERKNSLTGAAASHLQGTLRAIMQIKNCSLQQAEEIMQQGEEQGMTVKQFYCLMQEWLNQQNQILVEKSPGNSISLNILKRTELYFQAPLYIHLVRHPYGMIRSYVEAKLDLLMGEQLIERLSCSRRELAELTWTISVQNILAFLKDIPPERQMVVKFENLVNNPEDIAREICRFLNLEFHPGMLEPYQEKKKRMTDGVYAQGIMLGDMKFHQHHAINAAVAHAWQKEYTVDFLGEPTWQIARALGYKSIKELEKEDRIKGEWLKRFPLSFSQERLWLLDQLEDLGATYNVWIGLRLTGPLQIAILERCLNEIISRHEVLRTTFSQEEGQPVQVIGQAFSIPLPVEDMQQVPKEKQPEHLMHMAEEEVEHPFDLEKGPLLRVKLFRLAPQDHGLVMTIHHIISDAWSINIFIREMAQLYHAYTRGKPSPLPGLLLQYGDFASWQRQWLSGEVMATQVNYWKNKISGAAEVLELPCDHPRPPLQTFRGQTWSFEINRRLTRELKQLSQETGTTLFMVLLAAFSILLSRLSGKDDIVIGTPVANRGRREFESLIGFFLNTLLIRLDLSPTPTFLNYLQEVRQVALEAYEHQDIPFEKLVEELKPERNLSHSPLFQVLFAQQNVEMEIPGIPGLSITPFEIKRSTSKFDLSLFLVGGQRLKGIWEYNTGLFEEDTIARTAGYFQTLLEEITANPQQGIFQLSLLTEEQRCQLLVDWNNTVTAYPKHKTIHQLLEEQVERTPGHTALVGQINAFGGMHLSYRELNEKSNQLAHRLIEKGVQPDTLVGIMAEPSIETIMGILGILTAGGAYLPIDPDYPGQRIEYILADSNANGLVTTGNLWEDRKLGNWEGEKIFLERGRGVSDPAAPFSNLQTAASPSNLAYIIYTSGSTGKPKGVMVEHGSAVNVLSALFNMYPLLETDAYLLKTSLVFDVSVTELFGWFWGGGRLVIVGKDERKDPWKIIDTIETSKVTHINFVPSLFHAFAEALASQTTRKLSSLKYIFLAGEVLLPELVKKFRQFNTHISLENLYGPTEGTVYASGYSLAQWHGSRNIPIGKPLQNTALYILDRNLGPVPVGVTGELCIAGHGVARGYLNNPELTAKRFIEPQRYTKIHEEESKLKNDPLKQKFLQGGPGGAVFSKSAPPGRRRQNIYRTGDLARWLPDGNIEFLGRIDHQVKIRGFRVELAEIENCLLNHPEIQEVVVALRTSKTDTKDKYLCAYIVTHNELDPLKLREYLSNRLPEYMIPAYFERLEALPLSPSGKIQRQALPAPGRVRRGDDYTGPRNEIEKKLAEIWSEVLGLRRIGIDGNFFELGGHSLKGTIMISKLQPEFNIRLPLAQLFKSPTIRKLSQYIKKQVEDKYIPIEAVEEKEYYILSSAQKRLYILNQVEFASTSYNIPAVYQLEKEPDRKRLEDAFRQVIQRHESFRTSFITVNDEPVQKIQDEVEFEIEYFNLATENTEGTRGLAPLFKPEKNFIHPFALSRAPLLRTGIINTVENKTLLLVDMHHIISDGTSMEIFQKELIALYQKRQLSPLNIQYKDYARWESKKNQKEKIKKQKAYWLKDFEEEIPVLNLAMDYARPTIQSFEGDGLHFKVGKKETKALNQLAAEQNATLFMVLTAIFNILLAKLSGQEDIVVGTPVAGRRHPDLNHIIGMFVNTLALKNYPSGNKKFNHFLKELKNKTLEAFENQEYPFEELVEQLPLKRDTSRNPLFDMMFALQNIEIAAGEKQPENVENSEIKITPYEFNMKISKFDLTLIARETHEGLSCYMEYCNKLFKQETIQRFTRYFKTIAFLITVHPEMKISEIEIISEEEKKEILYDFNDTEVEYPGDKTIQELFTAQVEQIPDNIAVVGAHQLHQKETRGLAPLNITYKELNKQSHQLARLLIKKGVHPDTIVGIMVEPSIEMVVGILGILKAGGAYLPIDPEYPGERITYMLAESKTNLLLTTRSAATLAGPGEKVQQWQGEKIFLEDFQVPHSAHSSYSSYSSYLSRDLAYIIYTSGTTGKPKGVMVQHFNVVRLVKNTNYIQFKEGDRILQTGALEFDASTFEIWGSLLNGLQLSLVKNEIILSPGKLKHTIERNRITTI